MQESMKKSTLVAATLFTLLFSQASKASECHIITSTLDYTTMKFSYSNWYAQSIPIVQTAKEFKYTSFAQAYKDFDSALREYIRSNVCKKDYDGVANYSVKWQQAEKTYDFTANYDVFSYK